MSIAPNLQDPSVTDPTQSISSTFRKEQSNTISKHVHRTFSLFSAAWLFTLSIPLLFFPRILSLIFGSLLTATGEVAAVNAASGAGVAQQAAAGAAGVVNNVAPEIIRQLNVLERSLAGMTGLALSSLGAMLVVQTGSIPLTSSLAGSSSEEVDSQFRLPTIVIATTFFSLFSYYSYELGLHSLTAGNGAMALFGVWTILFATSSRVNNSSNKVSSYPFKNQHAEAIKKDL